jgi:hypothetical protein
MSEPVRRDYSRDPARDAARDARDAASDARDAAREPIRDPNRRASRWEPAGRESVEPAGVPRAALLRRVSWGAIIAGGIVALSIQLMLNMLGLAIGFGAVDPRAGQDQASGLAIGAGIWLAVATIISLFAGGWAAGRMAGLPRRVDGVLHGFVAWAVATFVAFYLVLAGAGALAGGALSIAQQGAQLTGGPNQQQVQSAQNEVQQLGQQARRSADQILTAASSGATWAFVALVVGALSAIAGGAVGTSKALHQEARRGYDY